MPATQSLQLVQAILNAIEDSEHSGVLVSAIRRHPREFIVSRPDGTALSLWVYAWTLTHGGRPSLPYEYRIQMTTVTSPLELNPHGLTMLIGYEPNRKVFGGFDIERHRTFTTGSPSVQIDIRTLDQALQDGLAFDRKSNNEIAVGIRPDQFMAYAYNAHDLHKYGRQAQTLGLLEMASSLQEITDEDLDRLTEKRKRVVQSVSRISRYGNFRKQVLDAYSNRCAVTKAQLRLVDAAHILPVGAPGSTDDVPNGAALAPTYHRAFDNGLIYLDEEFKMRINPERESALVEISLDAGLRQFKASLGRILLPQDRRQWPNVGLIRRANRFRNIQAG